MKKIITAALIFAATSGTAQPMAGMSAGYSLETNKAIFGLHMGAKIRRHIVYFNTIEHVTRESGVPQIVGLRYGYSVSTFQPFIGIDRHIGSADKNNDPVTRWDVAYGFTKYFKDRPLMLIFGKSGKYITASIGMYKLIE